jgi:hypothetical protein
MYEKPVLAPALPTNPGIDMNVTPLNVAPIIPIATNNQGEFLSAVKKLLLFTPSFVVKKATNNRSPK